MRIRDGQSVADQHGHEPADGLAAEQPRRAISIRFALPLVMKHTGKSLDEVLDDAGQRKRPAGAQRHQRRHARHREAAAGRATTAARLALDVFVRHVRHYLGAYLVELGGADVIVFTGGIGENGVNVRATVCANLEELGIVLDPAANAAAKGEMPISAAASRTQIWVVPTNEELIVARQAKKLLESD